MSKAETIRLKLKVVPNASSAGIVGWLDGCLKVRVTQQPEKGKANAAVEELISRALKLPGRSVKIVSGSTSVKKEIEITGLSRTELYEQLANSFP